MRNIRGGLASTSNSWKHQTQLVSVLAMLWRPEGGGWLLFPPGKHSVPVPPFFRPMVHSLFSSRTCGSASSAPSRISFPQGCACCWLCSPPPGCSIWIHIWQKNKGSQPKPHHHTAPGVGGVGNTGFPGTPRAGPCAPLSPHTPGAPPAPFCAAPQIPPSLPPSPQPPPPAHPSLRPHRAGPLPAPHGHRAGGASEPSQAGLDRLRPCTPSVERGEGGQRVPGVRWRWRCPAQPVPAPHPSAPARAAPVNRHCPSSWCGRGGPALPLATVPRGAGLPPPPPPSQRRAGRSAAASAEAAPRAAHRGKRGCRGAEAAATPGWPFWVWADILGVGGLAGGTGRSPPSLLRAEPSPHCGALCWQPAGVVSAVASTEKLLSFNRWTLSCHWFGSSGWKKNIAAVPGLGFKKQARTEAGSLPAEGASRTEGAAPVFLRKRLQTKPWHYRGEEQATELSEPSDSSLVSLLSHRPPYFHVLPFGGPLCKTVSLTAVVELLVYTGLVSFSWDICIICTIIFF